MKENDAFEVGDWQIEFDAKDYCVEFKIYEEENFFAANLVGTPKPVYSPWMTGYIKWDGCSNWEHDNQMHFCGLDACDKYFDNFKLLIKTLYEKAAELMPKNKDDILFRYK